jgi:hypothetical protein
LKRLLVISMSLLVLAGDTVRADLLHPRGPDFAARYQAFTMVMGPTRRLLYAYVTGTLHLLESRDSKLVEVRTRDLWSPVLRMIAVDLDGDHQDEVVGYTQDARLFVLRGTDLQDVWNTPINRWSKITAITVGDVDQDGEIEILIIADRILRVYKGLQDVEEWKSTITFDDTDMCIGDVDGDGRDELVLNGGKVYDAYFRNLEWGSETGGFGADIELYDIDNDGKLEVIGVGADGLVRIWDIDEHRQKFN